MAQIPLAAFGYVLAGSVFLTLLLYWGVICRKLYEYGARFPTGLMFWRCFHELRLYRDVCGPHDSTATVHLTFLILFWFDAVLLVIWSVCAFWQYTHPVGAL
jgi:hypothetical protein